LKYNKLEPKKDVKNIVKKLFRLRKKKFKILN